MAVQLPRKKSRSWRPWVFGSLALLFLLTCVGLLIWRFGWDWTGFNAYSPPTPQYQRGKTLWDWLQLLIVPAILAAGAGFFAWWSARTERQIAQQRYEQDQNIVEQRYEQDQNIAEQRYKQDQELALDKQREDLLQSYLDRMAELLLEKGLRDSQDNAEVRKVARTRTVSTLTQLDGKRARTIFVFLGDARLTEEPDPIVSFENADLSSVKWNEGNLSRFNLSGADLSGADLSRANLSEANLSKANLSEANLSEADLSRADLSRANLNEADLSKADLSEANLSKAKLSKAKLSRAKLSGAKLSGADLSGIDLSGIDLSGIDLRETNLRANLSRVKLSGADLSKADLNEANLSEANLSKADLSKADLNGVILFGAILREAILSGANLSKADLDYANLSEANLSGANLSGANLSGANLGGAYRMLRDYANRIREVKLSGSDLSNVQYLDSAHLDKTILRGVKGLTPEQLADCKARGAIVDEEATPPSPSQDIAS